jgi:hypothetical protein
MAPLPTTPAATYFNNGSAKTASHKGKSAISSWYCSLFIPFDIFYANFVDLSCSCHSDDIPIYFNVVVVVISFPPQSEPSCIFLLVMTSQLSLFFERRVHIGFIGIFISEVPFLFLSFHRVSPRINSCNAITIE